MGDGSSASLAGVLSVIILVVANGFFVASEFSLVAMRRSRVAQLVAAGRVNARALQNAVEHLDYISQHASSGLRCHHWLSAGSGSLRWHT